MATVNPTVTYIGDNAVLFSWTLTQANTDGAPIGVKFADFRDRTVQMAGTWDSATVVWQGSNVASSPTYATLNDAQGSAISKTSDAGPEQVMEATLWQRPNASGGGATQSVVVSCYCVRTPLPRN